MSTLSFAPRAEDDRRAMVCRCENPKLPAGTLEYSSVLSVHYLPQVSIKLSNFLDPEKIREGGDVFFECHIRASPPVYKKEWRHNNRVLEHSKTDGIIISNYSLALQSVQRRDAGVYMCVGFNSEGESESNSIFLDIKYAPVCKPGLQRVYGVAKRELASVLCDVEANPADVRFHWEFNNTSETRPLLRDSTINSTSTRSVLHYRPRSEMDYGTVTCSAANDVGGMATPCVFHILAAGPPDPLFNCSVENRTSSGLLIACMPGFDGGVAQSFLLNVYADVGNRLVFSRSSAAPRWWVDGLLAGRRYRLQAVAENAKGRSSAVVLDGSTLNGPPAHQQTAQDFTIAEMQPEPAPAPPLLAALVGVLGSLALLALASVVACLACRRRGQQPVAQRTPAATQLEPLRGQEDGEDAAENSEDRGPDVVPEDPSYEVYQIAGGAHGTSTAEDPHCSGDPYAGMRSGGIPLRTLNHIVPLSPHQGMPITGVTSSPPVTSPPRSAPAVYATVDRRRGQGAVSRLRASDTRAPLLPVGDSAHSSL